MSKISKQWLELNWNKTDGLKSSDIPYSSTQSIKDKLDSLQTTVKNYLIVKDVKENNVDGGTFTKGAWRTRDLNTIEVNNIIGASLNSTNNRITLPQGEYDFFSQSPSYRVDTNQTRLYNITTDNVVSLGTSVFCANRNDGDISLSHVFVNFIINETTVFELQHICQTTRGVDGFGYGANFGQNNIYSVVKICKLG